MSNTQTLAPVTDRLLDRFISVRSFSEVLCRPLTVEDHVIQSMPDASPTKWHLAHTTWFFETFVLGPHFRKYPLHHEQFAYLFNSYYVQAGERFSRPHRGLLSRPTVAEVYRYRAHVDRWMAELLADADDGIIATVAPLMEIGLNHEQQHQELILTDIKHMLGRNPLFPAYAEVELPDRPAPGPVSWMEYDEGIRETGFSGDGFHFDNEEPRHRVFLEPYALADRPVTNREFLAFMEDDGYQRAPLWLSEGFATVEKEGWTHPFYWVRRDGGWHEFTLAGLRPVDPEAPVCHLSLYEADAYARWADARLPTEAEWEAAAGDPPDGGHFVEDGYRHPLRTSPGDGLRAMYGDTWEWTSSSYRPYPGYRPVPGALGEYNGKFMCNQYVLRGGSCATPRDHIRRTYRNFFPAHARWQFTGVRLARSL